MLGTVVNGHVVCRRFDQIFIERDVSSLPSLPFRKQLTAVLRAVV